MYEKNPSQGKVPQTPDFSMPSGYGDGLGDYETDSATADWTQGWGGDFSLEGSDSAPQTTAEHGQTTEERRGKLSRFKRPAGRRATQLAGLARDRDLGGTFGADGSLAQGIDRAAGWANRADEMANSRGARIASKAPVVGGYVKAAREAIDAVHTVTEVAGHYSNVAGGIAEVGARREELVSGAAASGREAASRIATAGARGAFESLADQTGIGVEKTDRNGEVRRGVKKRKLAGFALRTVRKGGVGGLLATGAEAARAGAEQARSAADAELDAARQQVRDTAYSVYETGETPTFGEQSGAGDLGGQSDAGDWGTIEW